MRVKYAHVSDDDARLPLLGAFRSIRAFAFVGTIAVARWAPFRITATSHVFSEFQQLVFAELAVSVRIELHRMFDEAFGIVRRCSFRSTAPLGTADSTFGSVLVHDLVQFFGRATNGSSAASQSQNSF